MAHHEQGPVESVRLPVALIDADDEGLSLRVERVPIHDRKADTDGNEGECAKQQIRVEKHFRLLFKELFVVPQLVYVHGRDPFPVYQVV